MSRLGHNNPPSNGWIAIDRAVLEHQIVGAGKPVKPAEKDKPAYTKLEAWFDILRITSYKPQIVNNVGQKMTLNRGDFMGAIRFLGARWNWTKRTVEGILKKHEENGMLTNVTPQNDKNGNYKTGVYRVENYNKYQSFDTNDGTREGTQKNSLSNCNLTINSAGVEMSGDRSGTPQGTPSVTGLGTLSKSSTYCNIKENLAAEYELGDTSGDSKGDTFGDKYNNNNKSNNLNKSISNSSLRSELESSENEFSDPDDLLQEEQGKSSGNKKSKNKPDLNYTASFEDFWKAYPTDRIMSKSKTFVQWKKLDDVDKERARQAVPIFFNHCKQNPDYRPVHAERFISQRRFDGLIDQGKQHYQPAVKNQQQGKKSKLDQIREHRERRMSDAYQR